jgi:hypothetical protein
MILLTVCNLLGSIVVHGKHAQLSEREPLAATIPRVVCVLIVRRILLVLSFPPGQHAKIIECIRLAGPIAHLAPSCDGLCVQMRRLFEHVLLMIPSLFAASDAVGRRRGRLPTNLIPFCPLLLSWQVMSCYRAGG